MLSHFEAALCDYEDDDLKKLREKCIVDVKKCQGLINFENIVQYQRGNE